MKHALRALVFDVDGTLADTEETHRQAFNDAFREHRLPYEWPVAEYEVLLDTAGGKERLLHYFSGLDVPDAERAHLVSLIPSLHAWKNERYGALVAAGHAKLRPGVARLFDEAERAGIALGIATTTSEPNVRALLTVALGAEAPRCFAVCACGDVVKAKKPAPDIYTYALDQLRCAPGDAVAFEDSANGLAAARAAGLFTVVTPSPWTARHDLSAADLLLPHLGDPDLPLPPDAAARAGAPFVTAAVLALLIAGESP